MGRPAVPLRSIPVRRLSLHQRMRVRTAKTLATILAIGSGASALGADFLVSTENDTVDAAIGDGLCADAHAACSLRAAVQETNALVGADRIDLPAGTFVLSLIGADEDFAASGDLDIRDALTIVGAGEAATTIDGNAADTVLEVHSPSKTAALESLSITNGLFERTCADPACEGAGGVIAREGVDLGLRHVELRTNNVRPFSGMSALLNLGCVDGDFVRVIDNGGATGEEADGAIGGPRTLDGPRPCITLDHAEIARNKGLAGAMWLNHTRLTLRRSVVHSNQGRSEGAFTFNVDDEVLLENVTIAGNRGRGEGAILVDGGSTVRIRHATITDNEGGNGGGVAHLSGGHPEHLTLSNTLLTGNRDLSEPFLEPDCFGPMASAGGLLVGSGAYAGDPDAAPPDTFCFVQPFGPIDQIPMPLALGPLADHGGPTWSILPTNSAIDAGLAEECTPTDQRDVPRPSGAGCDLGAVELGAGDAIFADGFDRVHGF